LAECLKGKTSTSLEITEDITNIAYSTELVILPFLFRVVKNCVSLIYLLELLIGLFLLTRVAVRVILHCQPSVGSLNDIFICVPTNAEDLVIVSLH